MNRRYIPIFIIVLVNFFGATIVQPVLPLYAGRHFGAPDSIIPLLNTSYFAAQFLAAPFLGRLSDKYGRIPVLIVSQIGTVLSFLMMAWAQSLDMLFLARILDGITGGNVIVAQAYMTDISPREERTRALGLVFAAFGIGYTFGPAVGGALVVFGEQMPFLVGAAVSLGAVILIWLTLDESLSAGERMARRMSHVAMRAHDIVTNLPLVLILVIAFCVQFAMSLWQSTFPLFGERVIFAGQDPALTGVGLGILLGTAGVSQFITQLVFIKPIVGRLGERRVVILGGLLRAFGFLSLVVLVAPVPVGIFSLIPLAAGAGLMMPPLQSLATTSVPEQISGGVLGIYGSSTSLGIIIGSLMAGPMFAAQPTLPYLVGGTVVLVALIPAFFLLRQERTLVPAEQSAAV